MQLHSGCIGVGRASGPSCCCNEKQKADVLSVVLVLVLTLTLFLTFTLALALTVAGLHPRVKISRGLGRECALQNTKIWIH